jgi:release factor glutamine methyltransferase
MTTCRELLRKGTIRLREDGIEAPRLEAEVLLAHAWGRERTDLFVFSEDEVPSRVVKEFCGLLDRRCRRVPIAYLTGEKEFMSLPFTVNPEVLIPRPETELLVERVLDFLREKKGTEELLIADVGTGSGAVAVSLAFYSPRARLLATDISCGALEVARENAHCNGVGERVEFLHGDLLAPLLARGMVGVGTAVAANLPYIPSSEMATLPPDVRYEPSIALDGGEDGLDLYRRLVPQAAVFLASGGLLACEVGPGQAAAFAGILDREGWRRIGIDKDYRGLPRLVTAVRG